MFAVRHACLNAGLGLGALAAAAVVSVTRPTTFTAIYLLDAASFLAFVPVLARLRPAAPAAGQPPPASEPPAAAPGRAGFRAVLADRAFVRVWALAAVLVTVSFGQSQSSFAGYATRPGGIGPHGLALAFAANTVTVVAAQLVILRRLAGHRRTTAAGLASAAWAASWAMVIAGGHLGGGAAAGGAALGAGQGTALFAALAVTCAAAAASALRLGRHLPAAANHIPGDQPAIPQDEPGGDYQTITA